MKLYEMYEGEYLKFYNLTSEQCAELAGVAVSTIYNASKTGGAVKGKYKIKVSHESLEEITKEPETEDYLSPEFQNEFIKRWDRTCKPFRGLSERKNKRRKENANNKNEI